jgi:hypothetical protein
MSGWLATRVIPFCLHAACAEVERRWLHIAPRTLARHLPAAGPVLYLPCAVTPATAVASGLLAGCRELAPLLRVRWLVPACAIGCNGPREWLECRAGDGRLCARLQLLPDSDEGSRMLTTPPAPGVESERAVCGPRAATSAITRSEADVRRPLAGCLNP